MPATPPDTPFQGTTGLSTDGEQDDTVRLTTRAWRSQGGMTLHVMSDVYDQGDIIATTAFVPSDWQSGSHLRVAITQSLSQMAVEVIPKFCQGLVAQRSQPAGDFPDAQYTPRAFTVMADWTVGLLFGRASAELGQLGHPEALGDPEEEMAATR